MKFSRSLMRSRIVRDVFLSVKEKSNNGEQYIESRAHMKTKWWWWLCLHIHTQTKNEKRRENNTRHTQNHLTPIKWWTRESHTQPIGLSKLMCCALCAICGIGFQVVVSFFPCLLAFYLSLCGAKECPVTNNNSTITFLFDFDFYSLVNRLGAHTKISVIAEGIYQF